MLLTPRNPNITRTALDPNIKTVAQNPNISRAALNPNISTATAQALQVKTTNCPMPIAYIGPSTMPKQVVQFSLKRLGQEYLDWEASESVEEDQGFFGGQVVKYQRNAQEIIRCRLNPDFVTTVALYIESLKEQSNAAVEKHREALIASGKKLMKIFKSTENKIYSTVKAPDMPFAKYFQKLVNPAFCSFSGLIYTLIFLERYFKICSKKGFNLHDGNIKAYFVAAYLIGAKRDDDYFDNVELVESAQMSLKELSSIEYDFLVALLPDSSISSELFIHYQLKLLDLAEKKGFINLQTYKKEAGKLVRLCYSDEIFKGTWTVLDSINSGLIKTEITKFQEAMGWPCFVSQFRMAIFNHQFNAQQMLVVRDKILDFCLWPMDLNSRLERQINSVSQIEALEIDKIPVTLNFSSGNYELNSFFGDYITCHGFCIQRPSFSFIASLDHHFKEMVNAVKKNNKTTGKHEYEYVNLFANINAFRRYLVKRFYASSQSLMAMFILLCYYDRACPTWIMNQSIYPILLGSFLKANKALDALSISEEHMATSLDISVEEIQTIRNNFDLKVNPLLPENIFADETIKKWETEIMDWYKKMGAKSVSEHSMFAPRCAPNTAYSQKPAKPAAP